MNQGKIWCVVNPTVGLPLFLGSVTAIAIGVHAAVLSHTTWFGNYWQGGGKKTALNETVSPAALASTQAPGFTINVAPQPAADGTGATAFVVTVTPSGTSPTMAKAADGTKLEVSQLSN